MRKKSLLLAALLILVATAVSCLVGCKETLEFDDVTGLPTDYSGMEISKDYNAIGLFAEAYGNYLKADDYKRVQYYSQENPLINMYINTIRKVNGEELFLEEVVLMTGLMSQNEAKRVYFNQTGAYALYSKDKKVVPGTGEGIEKFNVTDWPDYSKYEEVEYYKEIEKKTAEEFKSTIKDNMVLYNASKAEFMAKNHDNNVYCKDDIYYFTLTIDCTSEGVMEKNQSKVIDAIEKKTNGDRDELKMLADTTIQVSVKEINGKMMITALEIKESFHGKMAISSADIKQVYSNVFDWTSGVGKVSIDELGNLA